METGIEVVWVFELLEFLLLLGNIQWLAKEFVHLAQIIFTRA